MTTFKDLGLSDKTLNALEKKGFETPTPIQELTIPLLLEGTKDVIGKAQTGTGKTACFALPIIENISAKNKEVQAIILAPTRELALQVSKEIESLQGDRKLHVLAIYGGASMRDQINALKRGVQIVVGTPGRVMDLMKRGRLDLSYVSYAVLDEADEMLNMGFVDDIKEILSKTSRDKHTLFFSATMPKEILKIAKTFMNDYEIVSVKSTNETTNLTKQMYYNIKPKDRMEALHRIIDITDEFHGIVFCKTRLMVDEVTHKLISSNYEAAALHGDISQGQREKILGSFRRKKVKVLVATDVAARGIDVNDLTHVINFSLPQSPESYVHRIGRTGRAGKEGIAITFLIPSEKRKLRFIERIVKQELPKGTLPTIQEVLELKKKALKAKLNTILDDEHTKKYDDIAAALLKDHTPEKAVAALLKYIFKSEIEPSKYHDVAKVSGKRERGFERGRGGKSQHDRGGRSRSGRQVGRKGGRSSRERRAESRSHLQRDFKPRKRVGRSEGGSRDRKKPSRFAQDSDSRRSKKGSSKEKRKDKHRVSQGKSRRKRF